ncbi:MAG: OB-fold domain-containing protein [Deltaproteobacteria bacterium]|nr:OB-fold domain-containing protein [Deltaproteobacteria bacterium]
MLGGYCPGCRKYLFPAPRYCPACLEPTEKTNLGSEGTLYSFTVVRTKPPLGLPQPYSVGYVDLPGSGLRVFSLLDPEAIDRLRIGRPLRLAAGFLGHDGRGSSRWRPYFTPLKNQL